MPKLNGVVVTFANGQSVKVIGVDHFSFSQYDVRLFADEQTDGKRPSRKELVYAYPISDIVTVCFIIEDGKYEMGDNSFVVKTFDKREGSWREGFYNDRHQFAYNEYEHLSIFRRAEGDSESRFFAMYNGAYVKSVTGFNRLSQEAKARLNTLRDENGKRLGVDDIVNFQKSRVSSYS